MTRHTTTNRQLRSMNGYPFVPAAPPGTRAAKGSATAARPYTLRLTDSQRDALKAEAQAAGVTPAHLVNLLITGYLTGAYQLPEVVYVYTEEAPGEE